MKNKTICFEITIKNTIIHTEESRNDKNNIKQRAGTSSTNC